MDPEKTDIYVKIRTLGRIGKVLRCHDFKGWEIDLFCRNESELHYRPFYEPWEVEILTEMQFLAEASR